MSFFPNLWIVLLSIPTVISAQTNNSNSEYKDYTVYKYQTPENDTGVWFCGSDQLEVWSEPEVGVISTNPGLPVYSWTAVINQTFTFVSSVIGNIYKKHITFKRGNEKICRCKYKTRTCETNKELRDNYRCKFVQRRKKTVLGGTTYSLTVSSFSVNDLTSWTCRSNKYESNIVTPIRFQTPARKINLTATTTTKAIITSTLLNTSETTSPPNIPSNVNVQRISSSAISVSWTEEFHGGFVQTFIVQYRENTSTQWKNVTEKFLERGLHTTHTTVIASLNSETKYLVRILAYNKYGDKGFTDERYILTADDESNENVIAVTVGSGSVILVLTLLVIGTIFICRRLKEGMEKMNIT